MKFVGRIVAFAAAVLSLGSQAAQVVESPAFRLKLDGDWKAVAASDPEQQSLYSTHLDVGLTTSYLLFNAKPSDTERIAQKLREFRLRGEDQAAAQYKLRLTIVEPIVLPFAKGHQVAYYGHDSEGRQFRYLGLVFPNKTINVYAESKSRSQAELEAIFNQMLKGLTS